VSVRENAPHLASHLQWCQARTTLDYKKVKRKWQTFCIKQRDGQTCYAVGIKF